MKKSEKEVISADKGKPRVTVGGDHVIMINLELVIFYQITGFLLLLSAACFSSVANNKEIFIFDITALKRALKS